jgi:signal transduction histidine kinase/CheY-like chemotaxis protein
MQRAVKIAAFLEGLALAGFLASRSLGAGDPARPSAGLDAWRDRLLASGILAIIAAVTWLWIRRNERALRDAVGALENQTIVLEQQAARLQAKQRELNALNRDLEERVAHRTSELAGANLKLELASRAKSEFLANMSHEIRTPMTAVQGYADLLLDPELSPEDRLGHVQTIRRNGEHLLSILNDILDISKIEAGKMDLESIPCSPWRIVAEVTSLMRERALSKGLAFELRCETPIPASIRSDPTRLRQILINLVGNAVKFTARGHVHVVVRCEDAATARPRLSFEVEDTGIGLSAAQIERLFQPFSQVDTSMTRRFGGTGLGLAICLRLAGMLGGDVRVDSVPGRGTSFIVTVETGPLEGGSMLTGLTGAPVVAPSQAPPSPVRLEGAILLAEDGPDNQVLIAGVLRKAGALVTIAENGRIAVERALAAQRAGAPFDVILMDMQMPELDGYGAAAALRREGYAGPIAALTAHAMAGDRERCVAAGCDDYLTKPIDRHLLLHKVGRWLELRGGGAPAAPAPAAPLRLEGARS